jgi:CHASE3 domain sensor protein
LIPSGSANICPGEIIVTNDSKKVFDGLLEDYTALDESADIIVRQLRKISNPDSRRKIIKELRNLEDRRLEFLDQMDDLAKPI